MTNRSSVIILWHTLCQGFDLWPWNIIRCYLCCEQSHLLTSFHFEVISVNSTDTKCSDDLVSSDLLLQNGAHCSILLPSLELYSPSFERYDNTFHIRASRDFVTITFNSKSIPISFSWHGASFLAILGFLGLFVCEKQAWDRERDTETNGQDATGNATSQREDDTITYKQQLRSTG